MADEHGMVEKGDYLEFNFLTKDDKRMRVDNKVVTMQFISDEMPPTQNMASGKFFTSKKKFRNETKAYGCIEVGNDTSYLKPRKQIKLGNAERRETIKRVVEELKTKQTRKQRKKKGIDSNWVQNAKELFST